MRTIRFVTVICIAMFPSLGWACINSMHYGTAYATYPADYTILGLFVATVILFWRRSFDAISRNLELAVLASGVVGGLGIGLAAATHQELTFTMFVASSGFVGSALLISILNRTEFGTTGRVGVVVWSMLLLTFFHSATLLRDRVAAESTKHYTFGVHQPVEQGEIVF